MYYSIQCISKCYKHYFNSSINYNVMPFSSHLFEYLSTETKMSLFYHYKIHTFSAIVSSLNCNNFGSNKGIVIKLIVMWSVTYYLSFKHIACGNFVEVPTAGLPTIFSVTIIGCGGAGLSRDHLYAVGPGPKVHLVAVTKSQVIHFD